MILSQVFRKKNQLPSLTSWVKLGLLSLLGASLLSGSILPNQVLAKGAKEIPYNLTICSDAQEYHQMNQYQTQSIFTGDVSIKYNDNYFLTGDKVIVTENHGVRVIRSYGKPTIFQSTKDNFYLESSYIQFNLGTGVVIADNAKVNYNGNRFLGATVTYNTQTKALQAKGTTKRQAETIITNFNNKGK